MKRMIQYPITNFFVGELYLYTKFGNLVSGEDFQNCKKSLDVMLNSEAICFQKDLISRYIDWENSREYIGFLTIFYKQDNKYICLHDGKIYTLNSSNIIDNLVPLNELLPKIDKKSLTRIGMCEALELFDVLFKEEISEVELYKDNNKPITDFIVGDIALRERTPVEVADARVKYIDLPHHLMLEKDNLSIYSFSQSNYINTVYRCLFLKDGVDLYNLHNHQFYNPHEDVFDNLVSFPNYMDDFDMKPKQDRMSVSKALRLFKKTI